MKSSAKLVVIFLISTSFSLLIAEALLRFLDIKSKSPMIEDSLLNHTWKPNSEFRHDVWSAFGIPAFTHKYNSDAFIAERDLEILKDKNAYRIFFLGDSFTEGIAPMEKSMPNQVQALLTDDFLAKGKKLEVINAGTSSYAPTLYYLQLKYKILKYKPDMLVISVDMTDVFDDFLYSHCLELDSEKLPISCSAGAHFFVDHERTAYGIRQKYKLEKLLLEVSEYSYLADFLKRILAGLLNHRFTTSQELPGIFDWSADNWDQITQNSVDRSIAILGQLIDLAKAHNIKVILTLVPHLQNFEGRWSERPFAVIQDLAISKAVLYFDSFAALKSKFAAQRAESYFIPRDMHFNEKGYGAWAEGLAEFLKSSIEGEH